MPSGDGKQVVIGGVMQHIEEAGVHSGDSSSVLPPYSLSPEVTLSIEEQTRQLGLELGVLGLMNVQFAVKGSEIFVIEVNPRASRTVPFVSKATGRPLAKIAAQVMAGKSLAELGVADAPLPAHVAVKESVFPFAKFPVSIRSSGREMRSDRRGDGIAPDLRARVREGAARVRMTLPVKRAGVHLREERRQAGRVRRGAAIARAGFHDRGDGRDGGSGSRERASRRQPSERWAKVAPLVDAIKRARSPRREHDGGAKEIRDSYSIRRAPARERPISRRSRQRWPRRRARGRCRRPGSASGRGAASKNGTPRALDVTTALAQSVRVELRVSRAKHLPVAGRLTGHRR